MREMNRLGVTGVIDAGGGFQNYPDDYEIIQKLHADGQLTLRIAYNLFTQKKGEELADFTRWGQIVRPGQGDDTLRHNGAGEMLVFSAADFEDFREPRPELGPEMGTELADVVACSSGTVGLGGCTPPTTRRSRVRSTRSNRSTARCPSAACIGSWTIARPSATATSIGLLRLAAASPFSTA
jgi:hypothetical protein